jgi:predicted alpha/beta-hydrolase family hydrolase
MRVARLTMIRDLAIGTLLMASALSSSVVLAVANPAAVAHHAARPALLTQPEPPTLRPEPVLRGRAYLVRGLFGLIFSRGMNGLADQLSQQGVAADTYDFPSCDSVTEAAEKDYRKAPAPIVLIGHSMGGRCVLLVAEKLREDHIPVSLLVTVDPARGSPGVPLNVERYINIFLSRGLLGGGDVRSEQGYQGHYASFDLSTHSDVSHITIDKMDTIHDQLIAKVAQLAATPARAEDETVALRYIVPPDTPVELWDSGVPVIARPGDTLETIAAAHQVPLWAVTQINPGVEGQPLIPGERVIVPRHLGPPDPITHPRR